MGARRARTAAEAAGRDGVRARSATIALRAGLRPGTVPEQHARPSEMSSVIATIERAQLRRVPSFAPGDRVKVHFQVIEGQRRRVQVFEGVVIKRQGHGARETFTVRKQSFGVGVERMFPLHSPKIERIELAARGDVRRAKLYYLRDRVGKRARVRERRYAGPEEAIEPGLLHVQEATDAEGTTAEETVGEVAADIPQEGAAEQAQGATDQSEAPAEQQEEHPATGQEQGGAATAAEASTAETGSETDASEPSAEADDPSPDAGDGDVGSRPPASAGDQPA